MTIGGDSLFASPTFSMPQWFDNEALVSNCAIRETVTVERLKTSEGSSSGAKYVSKMNEWVGECAVILSLLFPQCTEFVLMYCVPVELLINVLFPNIIKH